MTVCLRLRVTSEAYAIPVEHVSEVAHLGRVRPVPGARPELMGIQNLRGQILPVFALSLLLGIPRTGPPGRLLVAEADGRRAGFAVDDVTGIDDVPDPGEDTESDLLFGATLRDGDLIGVIDMPRVLGFLERTPP